MLPRLIARDPARATRTHATHLLERVGLEARPSSIGPARSRAASSSASPWRERSSAPASSSPTSPPGNLDPATGEHVHQLLLELNAERRLPRSWSRPTTTASRRPWSEPSAWRTAGRTRVRRPPRRPARVVRVAHGAGDRRGPDWARASPQRSRSRSPSGSCTGFWSRADEDATAGDGRSLFDEVLRTETGERMMTVASRQPARRAGCDPGLSATRRWPPPFDQNTVDRTSARSTDRDSSTR